MRITAFLLTLLFGVPPTLAAPPKSLAETPLNECTPQTALGWMYAGTVDRTGDDAKEQLRLLDRIQTISASLPSNNRPAIESMNPAQAAEFATLSAQIRIHTYANLAESRLERDIHVMGQAVVAIETLRKGVGDLKTKDDPGGDGAGLVGLLREAAKSGDSYVAEPTDKTCTLDLALYMKQQATRTSAQKILASKEAAEMHALIAQYHMKQLDPSKLPSPDREKAIWLQKAVSEPLVSDMTAMADWGNLRRFAIASWRRYTILRDAIITSAGAEDYDYDAGLKKAYAEADAVTKRFFDSWALIDQNIPSEAAKDAEERAKIVKQSAGSH